MKDVLILGSTGSIGKQTLDIVRENPEKFRVTGLTCNCNIEDLKKSIREFSPRAVCVANDDDATKIQREFPNLDVYLGRRGLVSIAEMDCDIVLNALMGISGLEPTYAAISRGRDVALANKETLVTGGEIITRACEEKGVRLLPVDSEHSAIFQCLEGNAGRKIKRILLTASGGPFRKYSLEQLSYVGIEQALAHPKWNMGSKITIDSATLMNKGLEVIEAKWLFDVSPEIIEIHVHPESIVHSMVEFGDASIIAQMGLPDMRIPIGFALNYPDRLDYTGESLNFFTMAPELRFEEPRRDVFRCIDLAYDAIKRGGSCPVTLNGANEELVAMFLRGEIKFLDIQNTLFRIMEEHESRMLSTVEDVLEADVEARRIVHELI